LLLKRQFHENWGFCNGYTVHRKSIVSRSTAEKKKLFCVVIELINLKDPMRLIQKTYLFTVQIGMHLKSVGYTDTVLFPTIGNAVNVQSPDIGRPDIYRRKD
jgi:hypothetical protein